jgi:hypothetical protein
MQTICNKYDGRLETEDRRPEKEERMAEDGSSAKSPDFVVKYNADWILPTI